MELGNIAQWVGATATLSAVVVALFKGEILQAWRRPNLVVRIEPRPPDCAKTTVRSLRSGEQKEAQGYYLRLWIKNEGRTTAERVQVFAEKLFKQQRDGSFATVDTFLPMNLTWAHKQEQSGPEIYAPGIHPEMGKHCDLGHVLDPQHRAEFPHEDLPNQPKDQTIFAFALEVIPLSLAHLVRPGVYRLRLRVAGANCKPVTKIVELNIAGTWHAEEKDMFSDGFGVRMISD